MFSSVLKVLCWSNYFQQCIWMVFLASVVCVGLIIVGFGLFGQSWVVTTSGHMCESTYGLGVAPASQGGRQSWAGRWQDLEGKFPESRGQEDLGLRCSDWPATRPWWPRSACCCCSRIRLECHPYIVYYPHTETADWLSASPRCHYGKKNTNQSTNVHQVRRQKCHSVHAKDSIEKAMHAKDSIENAIHAKDSIEKAMHAKEHNATAKHTSPVICKSLGRAFRRERKSIRNRARKCMQ